MGVLKIITDSEADNSYLLNCVNYVTGGHTVANCFGGMNICPQQAYMQMMAVKEYYGKTSGNQLVHFIISLDKKVFDSEIALNIAYDAAKYYSSRYQIVFGVHRDSRTRRNGRSSSYLHIHMIMNSVSFVDGKKYAENKGANYDFVDHLKRVTNDNNWKVVYGKVKSNDESY